MRARVGLGAAVQEGGGERVDAVAEQRSTAGRTISAIAAAISATSEPPTPIEYRKRCGKTSSEASAPATVSELKSTVRPAVAIVRRIAVRPGTGLGDLLAISRDHEEAVVDRQAEAEAGDEVEREDRDRAHLGRAAQHHERADDCQAADEQGQQSGDEAAEEEQREQEEDRERVELRACAGRSRSAR